MPRSKSIRIRFNPDRLQEAITMKYTSVKQFSEEFNLTPDGCSERSIWNYLEKQEMPPNVLDSICQFLDIDPDYILNKYHDSIVIEEPLHSIIISSLTPQKFPYKLKSKRDELRDGWHVHDSKYILTILRCHGVPETMYTNFTSDEKRELLLNLERAIVPVLMSYFDESMIIQENDGMSFEDLLLELELGSIEEGKN